MVALHRREQQSFQRQSCHHWRSELKAVAMQRRCNVCVWYPMVMVQATDPCELTLMPQMYTNVVLPMHSLKQLLKIMAALRIRAFDELARARNSAAIYTAQTEQAIRPKACFLRSNQFLGKCRLPANSLPTVPRRWIRPANMFQTVFTLQGASEIEDILPTFHKKQPYPCAWSETKSPSYLLPPALQRYWKTICTLTSGFSK